MNIKTFTFETLVMRVDESPATIFTKRNNTLVSDRLGLLTHTANALFGLGVYFTGHEIYSPAKIAS